MSNGPRCGVSTFLSWDTDQKLPHGLNSAEIESSATVIAWDGTRFVWQDPVYEAASLELESPPPPDRFEALAQAAWSHSLQASRVILPFHKIAPPTQAWWKAKSLAKISIPIGQAGAEGEQYFELGEGTAIHALVTGQTGSGKSNLLHMLILSLALAYSPEELELYLIDFKKGVEFNVYAPRRDGSGALPHARIVAIESDREFGLSCLQRLNAEMERRGALFRNLGFQNISEYR